MKPLVEIPPELAANIRFVLFDIDDTITRDGKMQEASFCAMFRLKEAGYRIFPVTGRPAGWCDCIARLWPVDGVIGENGAFAYFLKNNKLQVLYHPNAPGKLETDTLFQSIKSKIFSKIPDARIAKDQFSRLYDLAIDFAEEPPILSLEIAKEIKSIAESMGACAKISSIHVNIWYGKYDKLSMAEYLLSKEFNFDPKKDSNHIVYIGDSPNDEPMFKRFLLSIGVANINKYKSMMKVLPSYIASKPYGEGFSESVSFLLNAKNKI